MLVKLKPPISLQSGDFGFHLVATLTSSILYKETLSSGSCYLNMNSAKNKYYIIIENDSKNHKICLFSFPEKGNTFIPNEKNSNIKLSSYEILSSSYLFYSINNKDFKQNKIFYSIRFDEKYINKINEKF